MNKLTAQRRSELQEFQESLNIGFRDPAILNQAFTHSSFVNENNLGKNGSNERLEYLGDAVLGIITSEHLFKKYPDYDEGSLTKIKSVLVSKPILAGVSMKLGFGKYVLMGKGEAGTGGRNRDSTLANVFEAVLGAYFIDSGLEQVREFLVRSFLHNIDSKQAEADDYKSRLQEVMQAKYKKRPSYAIAGHFGPEHQKTFIVKAMFKGRMLGKGKGNSKKEAEQPAAKNALEKQNEKELKKQAAETK